MRTHTAAALLVALLLAACGTRLPDTAFETSGRVGTGEAREDGGVDGEELSPGGSGGPAGDVGSTGGTGGTSGPGGGTGGTAGGDPGTTGDGGTPSDGPNQASDVGITADTITLGNITAENGVLGQTFAPAVRGLRAWVQHVNATGGIHGRTVVLKTCDDREDRSRALECARRLVEQEGVFALVATNTRALGGAAQYLNDQGVPVLGFPITNSFYRYPHFFSAYPTGYERNGTTVGHNGNLVYSTGAYRWFKSTLGLTKAAVFSYDIDESKQAAGSFARGLELEGFEVTSYTVSFAAPSFDQPVADMQRRGTEIIFDSMDDGANRKLCDAMERRTFSIVAKVPTVVSMGEAVGDAYNDTCRNSVFVAGQSVPYSATSVPAVKEFRDAFARYQPGQPLHQWALEAWALGKTVGEGVAAMGPAPTRAGLEAFFMSLRGYTAGGIMVGMQWAPTDLSRPTAQNCFIIARWLDDEGGWVIASDPTPFCYPDAGQYTTPALEQGN